MCIQTFVNELPQIKVQSFTSLNWLRLAGRVCEKKQTQNISKA